MFLGSDDTLYIRIFVTKIRIKAQNGDFFRGFYLFPAVFFSVYRKKCIFASSFMFNLLIKQHDEKHEVLLFGRGMSVRRSFLIALLASLFTVNGTASDVVPSRL